MVFFLAEKIITLEVVQVPKIFKTTKWKSDLPLIGISLLVLYHFSLNNVAIRCFSNHIKWIASC